MSPRWYDISRPLERRTTAWPGDTPYSLDWTMRIAHGASVNVSRWTLSPHVGTHVDAPLHYREGGATPADLPLDLFVGEALVVDARDEDRLDEETLARLVPARVERLLVRTQERVDPALFVERFPPLTEHGARRLVADGLRLFGTDAPSVDPVDSKTLAAHKILGTAGVAILENLDLAHVPPGVYRLLALPLRVTEAEASPVRAILMEVSE
ncbi:MAG: arylformamidase [Gemmatimonadota bacterium]